MRVPARFVLWSTAAAVALLWAGGPSTTMARADDDVLRKLELPTITAEALANRLGDLRADLVSSDEAYEGEGVTWVSRDLEEARERLAADAAAAIERATAALVAAGLERKSHVPQIVIAEVRVEDAPPLVVTTRDARSVLVRRAPVARGSVLPDAPVRPDGPLLVRDVVRAGFRARIATEGLARGAGTSHGPGSLPHALSRAALSGVRQPQLAAWLEPVLAAWVELRAFPESDASTPMHVCGRTRSRTPAELIEELRGGRAPTSAEVRLFGRLLDRLVGSGPLGPALEEAHRGGENVTAALAALLADSATGEESCDAEGTLACPVCAGGGKVELSCPDCAGSGKSPCPSCGGTDDCFVSYCEGGKQRYVSGRTADCKFCRKGRVSCKACSNKGTFACRACRAGKVERVCVACVGGRTPCPYGGRTPAVERFTDHASEPGCPWCTDASEPIQVACPECRGTTFSGCRKCFGTTQIICGDCDATGISVMVYADGTVASATKCGPCGGKGLFRCEACKGGKSGCTQCVKGVGPLERKDCGACADTGKVACAACALERLREAEGRPTAEDAEANGKMLEQAVRFLKGSRGSAGDFRLRESRKRGAKSAGAVGKPGLYGNALTLWTLMAAGVEHDDPLLRGAWAALRRDAMLVVEKQYEYAGVQASAHALRALLYGGEDPEGPLVTGLVKRLVEAQQPNGFWHDFVYDEPVSEADAFQSLFAIEALRSARDKGVRVPSSVWSKALRAATSELGRRGPTTLAEGRVVGTDVASTLALVVICKAGTLGRRAAEFDYLRMPEVEGGLRWLDRHFSIEHQPIFSSGAPEQATDEGYTAWLYAVQRLAMLLDIDTLGGSRWHVTGARHLRSIQFADGSFEEVGKRAANGPVRATTSAVLFLVRATTPITTSFRDE